MIYAKHYTYYDENASKVGDSKDKIDDELFELAATIEEKIISVKSFPGGLPSKREDGKNTVWILKPHCPHTWSIHASFASAKRRAEEIHGEKIVFAEVPESEFSNADGLRHFRAPKARYTAKIEEEFLL